MTPTARFALYALRVYLLVMITLIMVKFVRDIMTRRSEREPQNHGVASDVRNGSPF
jgi:hypothetical protein